MNKLRGFYNRFLKNYIVLMIIIAAGLYLVIETLARHSLIDSAMFFVQHPLVTICNVMLIFALLSLSMLFRKRVFALCLLSMVWLILGIINGIILSNRMTPFTVKDLSSLGDGLTIVTNYFNTKTIILAVAAAVAIILSIILLYRKTPKLKEKVRYRKASVAIVLIFALTFGAVQVGMKAGVLDTFFGNLAYGYRDNGVPYSFLVTWVKTGIDKPADYSEEKITGIFRNGELGDDGIYTPGDDDEINPEGKPNIIFLQLESFIDPTLVEGLEFSKDPVPNYRKLMKEYSSGYLTVPSVGAGTANVEFEVMTGISAKFFGRENIRTKVFSRK